MTKSYKDLFEVHEAFIKLALLRTGLSHSLFKNIRDTGDGVEKSITELLKIFIPDRFKVVSGYVVSAKSPDQEPIISDQLDIIIVDTLVPHRLFQFDSAQILQAVPLESVVGLFEIKRSLNKKSFADAEKHLASNLKKLGISKNNRNRSLPGGINMGTGLSGGLYTNPIIGILSLTHSGIFKKNQVELPNHDLFPDIIASLDGFHMITSEKRHGKENILFRHENNNRPINYSLFNKTEFGEMTKYGHLALVFGFITTYLSKMGGQTMDFASYYLNHNLWR